MHVSSSCRESPIDAGFDGWCRSRGTDTYQSVTVNPDGAVARMGVRPGDMPFAFHGNGAAAMQHALMRGECGQSAEFDVVNADEWNAGWDIAAFRTIRVQPSSSAR
jgi:hypothetical protein